MSKLYFNGEEIQLSSQSQEIYSTEESRIGTWIDGKPLYRRVFEVPAAKPNLSTNTNVVSIKSTYHIVGYSGFLISAIESLMPINYYIGGNVADTVMISTWCGRTGYQIWQRIFCDDTQLDTYTNSKTVITVEYIKTTE